MPRDRDEFRLRHMLDHAREAVAMAGNYSEDDLADNRMLQLALVRLVEIIGEAAARVSPEAQARHSGVPWPAIVGMRNRLIHGYADIAHDIVWGILETNLPVLKKELAWGNPGVGL